MSTARTNCASSVCHSLAGIRLLAGSSVIVCPLSVLSMILDWCWFLNAIAIAYTLSINSTGCSSRVRSRLTDLSDHPCVTSSCPEPRRKKKKRTHVAFSSVQCDEVVGFRLIPGGTTEPPNMKRTSGVLAWVHVWHSLLLHRLRRIPAIQYSFFSLQLRGRAFGIGWIFGSFFLGKESDEC